MKENELIDRLLEVASENGIPMSVDNQDHLRYSSYKEKYIVLSTEMTRIEIIKSIQETLSYHLEETLIPSFSRDIYHRYDLMCEGCREE